MGFSAHFFWKKGFGSVLAKHIGKKEMFWSLLVQAEFILWKWYGRCEEDKSMLYIFGHDIRSCAVENQLRSLN